MEILDEQVSENVELLEGQYEDEETEQDRHNRQKLSWWKPGQSGNPAGRPKGKTMKEYVRDMLQSLTDTERIAFLASLPNDVIWKMAEGNPTEDKNITVKVPIPLLGGITQLDAIEQQKVLEDGHTTA